MKTFEAEAADLGKQLAAAVEARSAADTRAEALEKRVAEEHDAMKALHDKAGREMADKAESAAKQDAQIKKLTTDVANLTTQCDELKGHLKKALASTDMGAELATMHDRVTTLEGQKSALAQESTALQLRLDKEAVQNVKDAADLKEAQAVAVKLQHSLEREKEALAEAEQKFKDATTESEATALNLRTGQSDNVEMASKLKAAEAAAEAR